MAVVPVSPVLLNLKGVNVGIIRLYAHKTQPRNTIHIGRKNNAVPVNGRLFIKTVFDLQGNGVTFFPAKNGRLRLERALKLHTPRLPATPERVNPFRKVRRDVFNSMRIPLFKVWLLTEFENRFKLNYWFIHLQ